MTEDGLPDPDPMGLAALDLVQPAPPPSPMPPSPAPSAAVDKPKAKRNSRMKFGRQDLTRHVATCRTCGASNNKRNAQAWASNHVNGNGGHRVALVLEYVVADKDLDQADRLAVLDGAG